MQGAQKRLQIKLQGVDNMFHQNRLWIVCVCSLLVLPCASTVGQLPSRGGVGGGTRGMTTPRSGLGIRNNPVVNPSPSLTPSQVLNPRGSINTGQVLNPKGSLNRPRTGVAVPNPKKRAAEATSGSGSSQKYQSARPNLDNNDIGLASDSKQRVAESRPMGEQVLDSVVELDTKIAEVAPDKGYSDRLALDRLRAVPVFSEQPTDDEHRKELEEILKRYQVVAKDDKQADVNQLPEFKRTLTVLEEYMTPIDQRRRREARIMFDQLHQQLGKYKNGSPWAEYLSLPTDMDAQDATAQVTKLLGRFNKLASDKTYRKVTRLPAFGPAYTALKAVAEPDKAE